MSDLTLGGNDKRNTETLETYVGAASILVHLKSISIGEDVIVHAKDLPKSLVEDVGSKLALGDAHGIFHPGVFMHQPFPILERLDPPLEPTQDDILAGKPHRDKFGDPPNLDIQFGVVWQFHHQIPVIDLVGGSVPEGRKSLSCAGSGLVQTVEECACLVPRGLVRCDGWKSPILSGLESNAGCLGQRSA